MLGLRCYVGFSLVVASGGTLRCGAGASHCGGFSHCRAWTLGCVGFSSCGSWTAEHWFNSCGVRALLLRDMWIFLGQGWNPCVLHWQVDFYTTEPSGKPLSFHFKACNFPVRLAGTAGDLAPKWEKRCSSFPGGCGSAIFLAAKWMGAEFQPPFAPFTGHLCPVCRLPTVMTWILAIKTPFYRWRNKNKEGLAQSDSQ